MKLSALLLFVACLSASAGGNAQKVTLSLKNVTVQKVFKEVSRQTGVSIVYNESLFKNLSSISIGVNNATIPEVLDKCLAGQPFDYSLEANMIVIKKKPATMMSPQAANSIPPPGDIKGRVVNEKGVPVEGVSVSVKGTNKATSTNAIGAFVLTGVDKDATLLFTSVYTETFTFNINGKTDLVISLKTKVNALEDVFVQVNTGYYQMPLERATGAFTHISAAQIEKSNSFNLKDRIEGLVPGMYFETQYDEDQAPTSERSKSIVIRGVGTFGNNNPLIVVDGAPFYSDVIDPWSLINPSDVESITVLKDASAASIWGSQAANGVIVITTKKGGERRRQPMLNASIDYLVQPVPNLSKVPWASSKDALDIYKWMIQQQTWFDPLLDPLTNDKYELPEVMKVLINMKKGTLSADEGNKRLAELSQLDVRHEFKDLFFRKLESNKKINLSFQSGSEFNRVRTSLTGVLNNQYSKRNSDFQVTANFVDEYTPKKWLNFSFGSNVFMSDRSRNGVVVNDIVNIPQMSRILDDQGNYLPMIQNSSEDTYFDVPTWRRRDTVAKYKLPYNWDWNLKQDVDARDNSTKTTNLRLYTNMQITPFKGFVIDFYYQYQKDYVLIKEYYNEQTWYVRNLVNNNARTNGTYPIPPGGMLYQNQSDGFSHNGRLQLSYTRNFGNHSIRGLAGMEIRRNFYDQLPYGFYGYDPQSLTNITNLDFLNTIGPKMNGDVAGFGNSTIPFAPTQRFGSLIYGNDDRFVSTYANIGYTFKNKYDVTGSIRQDKTNLFGQSSTYTNLPQWSAGLGWKISDEKFFKVKFIDLLKLRLSYGFNGNIDKTASPYITGTPWTDPITGLPYAAVQSAPNPGLTWERTGTYNIGLDFALLKNRINGGMEIYHKRATDVLAQIAVNGTYGYQNNRATLNTGNITNNGIEFYVSAKIIAKDLFQWQTRFNYGSNRNRATQITQVSRNTSAYTSLAFYYHLPNQPVDYVAAVRWAGYDSVGLDKFLYQGKVYSVTDIANFSTLNPDDLFEVIGQRNPKHFGQWANTFSYKGLELNVSLLYKFGHVFVADYPVSGAASTYFTYTRFFTFIPDLMVNRWKSPADANTAVMYSLNNKITVTNYQNLLDLVSHYSTRQVLNAGSIRMQSISLSYRIPGKITGPLKDARIQLEARNLGPIYVVNDRGIDPDFPPYSSSLYGSLQYLVRNRPQYSASLRFGL